MTRAPGLWKSACHSGFVARWGNPNVCESPACATVLASTQESAIFCLLKPSAVGPRIPSQAHRFSRRLPVHPYGNPPSTTEACKHSKLYDGAPQRSSGADWRPWAAGARPTRNANTVSAPCRWRRSQNLRQADDRQARSDICQICTAMTFPPTIAPPLPSVRILEWGGERPMPPQTTAQCPPSRGADPARPVRVHRKYLPVTHRGTPH